MSERKCPTAISQRRSPEGVTHVRMRYCDSRPSSYTQARVGNHKRQSAMVSKQTTQTIFKKKNVSLKGERIVENDDSSKHQ